MEDTRQSKNLFAYNEILKDSDSIYKQLVKKFSLSDSAFWIIYSIRVEKPPITQKDIVELTYYPKQTINTTLKKLENEGYILMTEDNDKRKKQLVLTEKGEELARKTADIMIDIEKKSVSAFSEEEREMFFKLFKKYNNEMRKQVNELNERGDIKNEN